jgi:hypothetical protein
MKQMELVVVFQLISLWPNVLLDLLQMIKEDADLIQYHHLPKKLYAQLGLQMLEKEIALPNQFL